LTVIASESPPQPRQALPGQIFTIVIWGEDRGKFGALEETYRGKHACVTGKIGEYRGMPEIIASDPKQLMLAGK
jgi:hypothetical protein